MVFPLERLACNDEVANVYIYFCIYISKTLIVAIDIFCIFSYISLISKY